MDKMLLKKHKSSDIPIPSMSPRCNSVSFKPEISGGATPAAASPMIIPGGMFNGRPTTERSDLVS